MHRCSLVQMWRDRAKSLRGIGEPPISPAAPALANAVFAAAGRPLPEMPSNKHVDFV